MGQHTTEPRPTVAGVAATGPGRKQDGFEYVQMFLERHGYLPARSYEPGRLDPVTSLALARFQEHSALTPTGAFDTPTREEMLKPRCGIVFGDTARASGSPIFDPLGSQCSWDKNHLTYAFDAGTAQIPGDNEFTAVRAAFDTWQALLPLTFTEVSSGADPDILISWVPAHDPDYPDMVGSTHAHSGPPPGCANPAVLPRPLHFDDEEHKWRIGAEFGCLDVQSVALHEVGHLIGLRHAAGVGMQHDVMWPTFDTNMLRRVPTANDNSRARSLYWQQIDGNPATAQLAASGNRLYQRHNTGAIFEYTGTPMIGWMVLDANPATIQIVADGGELYQLHSTGAIFRYTGTPLVGWEQLDANTATVQLTASGGHLYQRHSSGAVYRYTGTPMSGWELLDSNPFAAQIVADGDRLYQRHSTGAIFRFTGTPLTGWELLEFAGSGATRIDAAGGVMYQFRLADGQIRRHLGGVSWETVDTDLRALEISVSSGNVYQLLDTGEIFRYPPGGGVEQMAHRRLPGRPVPVLIASSGTQLYHVRGNGELMRYHR
ncbi:matrixin family metalloprotease [Streptomyces cyanogenus]|uniref:Matrixin n=1 Tax=Streptomyces cyanogenus TaxID=80860 RepID=A0ABX7U3K7_STRCY|nr:matrixin family metalloprotease [Streptomyces cyanogenus]QTE02287.1 Matrixin [Streptomyces cyanogenus]